MVEGLSNFNTNINFIPSTSNHFNSRFKYEIIASNQSNKNEKIIFAQVLN